MERRANNNDLPPSWPSYSTAGESHRRRLLPPGTSLRQAAFINAQPDQTLDDLTARFRLLNFRNEPSYFSPNPNVGRVDGRGLVLRTPGTDYVNAGQSFVPYTLPEEAVDEFGDMGWEYYGHYPVMAGSDQDNPGFSPFGSMPDVYCGDSVMDSGLIMGDTEFLKHILHSQIHGRRLARDSDLDFPRLKDLRGQIVALAMDEKGCQFLLNKFKDISNEDIEMILMEVLCHVTVLMVDQHGNDLFQKLVEVCSEEQRYWILVSVARLEYELFAVCLNIHGTRSMQKLLENLTTQRQITLAMLVLSRGAVPLSTDSQGHHVIKHCLKCFSYEDNKCLLNEVAENCFAIATDKNGCCVLQSCIEISQAECRERLLAEITANAIPLAQDCYGNYVVQCLLGMKNPRVVTNLLRQFKGNYVPLSCNKFASNVVEMCLRKSRKDQSEQIVVELLRCPKAPLLLIDPFGNYVFQTALSVSEVIGCTAGIRFTCTISASIFLITQVLHHPKHLGYQKRYPEGIIYDALRMLVRKHSPCVRNNQYGKNILAWFEKRKVQYMHTNHLKRNEKRN